MLWLAHILRPLFLLPVVIAVLVGTLAVDAWVLTHVNAGAIISDFLRYHELYVPLVFGLVLISGLFHEFGHATACRYGGATPGAIGAGILIVWPAFYTDVTDIYRLDRRGRLRVDLGGIYFQLMFALATTIGYLATGFEPLLIVAFFQYVTIGQQFMPFLRLDGYYIVSDLIGVPELFSHVRPTLASLFRRSAQGQSANALLGWARLAIATWVALAVPTLVLFFAFLIVQTPQILTTSFVLLQERLSGIMAADGLASGSVTALRLALGLVPPIGLILLYQRIALVGFRLLYRQVRSRYLSKRSRNSRASRRQRTRSLRHALYYEMRPKMLIRTGLILVVLATIAVEGYYLYQSYNDSAADTAVSETTADQANEAGSTTPGGAAFDTTAAELNGASFLHRATPENISAQNTYLDHPLANGNPNAFLLVTQNWNPGGNGGVYNAHPVGVWYDSEAQRWAIFNQDRATMPVGAAFNVVVLKEAPGSHR